MEKKTTMDRRGFIERSALGLGVVFSTVLVGSCTDHPLPDPGDPSQRGAFRHGVASFDPTHHQVILWTRVTPAQSGVARIPLTYQLATDPAFTSLVKTERVDALADDDYTVSIDLGGLQANTVYYYRFSLPATGDHSPVGETRTLPQGTQRAEVKLAICSCSNYPTGLFNVYGAIALSDADVVLHLGDYIYEYGQGQYGTSGATAGLNRAHQPAHEILTLDDYRARYRQYRSDPQLQLVHQKKPFICVWDDHELANDAFREGAQNHNPGEGSFADRKANALKAYHEYIGVRTVADDRIYRSFSFGQILDLHMLDTRIIGRDRQLSYAAYSTPTGGLDAAAFQRDWLDPKRTLLGAEQLNWLGQALAAGKGTWQVLGQQVLMGKMLVPAELLATIAQLVAEVGASGSATAATFSRFQTQLTQLSGIKARAQAGDSTLTAGELARVQTVLPYNLDAWDGYPAEREAVYAMAKGKRLVALAGDTHNGWYSALTAGDGSRVGREVATPSVTSPGFESYLGSSAAALRGFEQALALLVDDLEYLNASQRGYSLVTFSNSRTLAQWVYVDTILTPSQGAVVGHSETIPA